MSFLEKACVQARRRVAEGYYDLEVEAVSVRRSLVEALDRSEISLICEVKFRSPTRGTIREFHDPARIAEEMKRGGADAISILTDPDNFSGSIKHLIDVSSSIDLPALMKDFVVSELQLEAARKAGASAALLIYPIFARGYSELTLRDAIDYAHGLGLEVLLEAYTLNDLMKALSSDADLIGVNSRDLDTLDLNLKRAYRLIGKIGNDERLVLESGITSASEIIWFKEIGVTKFLIGTSIMNSNNIASKIRELKEAGRSG